jgi:hypothetical protein
MAGANSQNYGLILTYLLAGENAPHVRHAARIRIDGSSRVLVYGGDGCEAIATSNLSALAIRTGFLTPTRVRICRERTAKARKHA